MVRSGGVRGGGTLAPAQHEFLREQGMRHIRIRHHFPQVMQQGSTLGDGDVRAQFGGDAGPDMADLDGMIQQVLPKRRAVAHPAQQLDDLWVQAGDARFQDRAFAGLPQRVFDFLLGFGDGLFDAARMNPAIHNQGRQGKTCDFAPDGVERRQDDRLGCLVNDDVYAGQRLEGPDVASLAADDAAFHVVGRQQDDRDGRLRDMVGGNALNGR